MGHPYANWKYKRRRESLLHVTIKSILSHCNMWGSESLKLDDKMDQVILWSYRGITNGYQSDMYEQNIYDIVTY
jgi:hypothetical protein